jgi:hypothetical protein
MRPALHTTVVGWSSPVHGGDDDRHPADRVNGEFEALSGLQSRRLHHLDLGQLFADRADTVNGLGTELDTTSDFADSEVCPRRSGAKYILSGRPRTVAVTR